MTASIHLPTFENREREKIRVMKEAEMQFLRDALAHTDELIDHAFKNLSEGYDVRLVNRHGEALLVRAIEDDPQPPETTP